MPMPASVGNWENRLYPNPRGGESMAGWLKAMTEGGMTRIKMGAICAYQETEGGSKLLVYTKDNSLFEIVEDIQATISKLDSEFGVN